MIAKVGPGVLPSGDPGSLLAGTRSPDEPQLECSDRSGPWIGAHHSPSSSRRIYPSETKTKPSSWQVTRSIASGLRSDPRRLWRHLTLKQARLSRLRSRRETKQRAKRLRVLGPTTRRQQI
ncbi:hypothetical protein F2Q68_00020634 [Brassica cretica]|uniref:Uncharacterized protein n=1 Tax=Brassica cretica TaxID=69181 RepID=A0A8S9G1N6_BRACR|nr:hypothetical protein F2Q68_00020634 [Brassica cretica]